MIRRSDLAGHLSPGAYVAFSDREFVHSSNFKGDYECVIRYGYVIVAPRSPSFYSVDVLCVPMDESPCESEVHSVPLSRITRVFVGVTND